MSGHLGNLKGGAAPGRLRVIHLLAHGMNARGYPLLQCRIHAPDRGSEVKCQIPQPVRHECGGCQRIVRILKRGRGLFRLWAKGRAVQAVVSHKMPSINPHGQEQDYRQSTEPGEVRNHVSTSAHEKT
jgi:hypothetical protein